MWTVSVSLRRFDFEIMTRENWQLMKIRSFRLLTEIRFRNRMSEEILEGKSQLSFPSPYGDSISKLETMQEAMMNVWVWLFPSPYGDSISKFSNTTNHPVQHTTVSVSLRRFDFEIALPRAPSASAPLPGFRLLTEIRFRNPWFEIPCGARAEMPICGGKSFSGRFPAPLPLETAGTQESQGAGENIGGH